MIGIYDIGAVTVNDSPVDMGEFFDWDDDIVTMKQSLYYLAEELSDAWIFELDSQSGPTVPK